MSLQPAPVSCQKHQWSNLQEPCPSCRLDRIAASNAIMTKQELGIQRDLHEHIQEKAAKNDQEKPDLSLIPYVSQVEHARAFMVGERKYNRYNYCKGHKASQLAAAAQRHLAAWFNGEERDPQDGQHHLGSVMACCSMILRQMELGTMKDDRYKGDK